MHARIQQSWMSTLVLLFIFAPCLEARSQETQIFRNKEAINAQKAYLSEIAAAKKRFEEESKAARSRYIESLIEAAKIVVESGDLNEVVKIRNEKTRIERKIPETTPQEIAGQIGGTTWTYNRPGRPSTISFQEDGTIGPGSHYNGKWNMIETDLIAVRSGKNIFLYRLDSNRNEFRVSAYGRVRTEWSVGKRINEPEAKK